MIDLPGSCLIVVTMLLLLASSSDAQLRDDTASGGKSSRGGAPLHGNAFSGDPSSSERYQSPDFQSRLNYGDSDGRNGSKFPTFGGGHLYLGGNFGGGRYGGGGNIRSRPTIKLPARGGWLLRGGTPPGGGSTGEELTGGKCGEGGSDGPWHECVGGKGDKCCDIITDCNSSLTCDVIPEGSPVTKDYREDRVRVFVDKKRNIVQAAPIRG